MYKTAFIAGIFFAATGVAIGAFGAHGLKPYLSPELAQTFETGVRYQMYHAFALLFTGLLYQIQPRTIMRRASGLFILGNICFSGSLYALTALKISGQVGLGGIGLITPMGGVCYILGWVLLLVGLLQKK